MGFSLMSGIIVDKELKEKLQVIFDDARKKIVDAVKENLEHVRESDTCTVYPFGNQTYCNYIAPKSSYDMNIDQRLGLLDKALVMNPVEHVYEFDHRGIDKIKAFVQRDIENRLESGEGGRNG